MWLLFVFVIGVHANCSLYEDVEKYGYPFERYNVVTDDGYILELNRIPSGRNQPIVAGKPVILMFHGLATGSWCFLLLGPDSAMAYNFADAGYDVWLPDARGTCNSRRHHSLNPDGEEDKFAFFNYSYHEIALYDLPAVINFILDKTGRKSINYVGHSQGGTIFLVLNSMKPEYNKKFISAHLLSGIAYQYFFQNKKLKALAAIFDAIYRAKVLAGDMELDLSEKVKEIFPPGSHANYSVKQLAHFGQNVRDKKFRPWKFPLKMVNLETYGSLEPPLYELSRIHVDTTFYYSLGDFIQDERDVFAMVQDLPNGKSQKIARETFAHTDYATSSDVKTLVTNYIIDEIKKRADHNT